MTTKWTGFAALAGIAAIALLAVGRHAGDVTGSSTEIATACVQSEPLLSCATTVQWGIPIGDGLFATTTEDFL
jgi:hypothetical protein